MRNILDYINKIKQENEGPRITAQEPRNMYAGGQLVRNTVDGSRPGYAGEVGTTNVERKVASIQSYYDKFGKETLDKIAKKRYGKVFNKLEGADLSNLKVRVTKFKDFIIENNRMPSEKEARKFGRVDRDITLSLVDKDKTVNIDAVRENLIKNKKKVTMVNNQFIFADEKLQQEFLDDMLLRYKYPKTSTAAKKAGVKSNKQIFETYFKGTYSEKGVHDLINRFKKTLGETFSRLHPSERDAHKLRREAKLLITQAGKRISGLDDFPAHHLFPIGDEFAHGTQDFTIIDKKTNSQLSGPNKQLVALAEQRSDLINDVQTGKINIKEFDIEIGKLDNQAQTIIDGHYKKFPKHDGLLNWRKAGSMVDDQGRFMDIVSKGTIGGDASKWAITDVNKQIKDLSETELATFRSDIKAKAKGSGVQLSSIGGVFDEALKSPLTKKAYGLARKLGVEFEAAFIGVDFINNLGKGIEPGEALQKSLQMASLNFYKGGDRKTIENVKKVAEELGFDPKVMDSLIKVTQSQLKITDFEKKINNNLQAIERFKEKDVNNPYIQSQIKALENMNRTYQANLDKETEIGGNLFNTYRTNVKKSKGSFKFTDEDINQSFTELQTAAFTKLERERIKSAKKKSTQVDVEAGPIGDVIQNALGGLWTYPKFAYDLINPFSPLPKKDAWKTEGMKEKERIIDMQKRGGPGELYRYNIARGFDIDQPVTGQAFQTLKEEQPYLGLAGGGRAGYMGGGITGIRKPSAIAPTGGPMSQGLRSLYNNGRKR